ncbi:MAG: lytic transglycosylase domain-containing protein [Brevinemataceae bacterium]
MKILKLKTVWLFSLFFVCVNLVGSGSIPDITEQSIKAIESTNVNAGSAKSKNHMLAGESELNINEFSDIAKLYCKIAASKAENISTLRKLLDRLINLKPNTEFLNGQKELMQAVIYYRLRIPGVAEQGLTNLLAESSLSLVKEEALKLLISYSIVSHNVKKIQYFYQVYNHIIPEDFKAYLDIVLKSSQEISQEDVNFVVNLFIRKPAGIFRHPDEYLTVLTKYKSVIAPSDIDRVIDLFLYDGKLSAAIPIMKLRISMEPVSLDILNAWSTKLLGQKASLVRIIKLHRNDVSDYGVFLAEYEKNINALYRGKVYYRQLSRYIGTSKQPYNVTQTERQLNEYLKGDLEEKYLELNSQRAFRNFLAFKEYDKIIHYSALMHEKTSNSIRSPYIDFWNAYALIQKGETNSAIDSLGNVVAYNPESYFGIVSQTLLNDIFSKTGGLRSKFFADFKKKRSNNEISVLNYAFVLYYLGNGTDKLYAKKILNKENSFRNLKSSVKLSSQQYMLMQSYLTLGLQKDARYHIYRAGITNPHVQDMLFSYYLSKSEQYAKWDSFLAHRSLQIQSKLSIDIDKAALSVYYPKPYLEHVSDAVKNISSYQVDPYLIYSIMRTESFYKQHARSRAGARGLMQIMPKTGEWLAGKYLSDKQNYSLYNPQINVFLGSVYLYDTINRMGFLPAIAAYNSGPGFVDGLIKRYNPQTNLELVEIHPKRETREYVKKVLESYQRYKTAYNVQSVNLISMLF